MLRYVILSHYNRTCHDKNMKVHKYRDVHFIYEDVRWRRW